MNLRLKKFNMAEIDDDKVVVLIGKRDTGKSYLCKDLLYYHQHIPVGAVISATESANQFYGKMIPPLFIHDEYDERIVSRLLQRQKKAMDKYNQEKIDVKKQGGDVGQVTTDPRAFLILDDCLYDSSWTKSKDIRSIFMNGRHYKLMFIVTMQYALGIPPNLRTNIDYVFILRENIVSNRKRLYESYAGMFPTFEVFCQVMDQCTENYECLVISNNAKSNMLEDQVFWYKAEGHDDFKIGAPAFWDYHNRNYNEEQDEDEFDPSRINARRNKVYINVNKLNDNNPSTGADTDADTNADSSNGSSTIRHHTEVHPPAPPAPPRAPQRAPQRAPERAPQRAPQGAPQGAPPPARTALPAARPVHPSRADVSIVASSSARDLHNRDQSIQQPPSTRSGELSRLQTFL